MASAAKSAPQPVGADAPTPEVIQKFRELMQETQRLGTKITELEMERNEHRLVEDTLKPLNPERRAYRMIGEVLVERTVKEVLPSVTANRENIEKTIAALREKQVETEKLALEIKLKYNLQIEAR